MPTSVNGVLILPSVDRVFPGIGTRQADQDHHKGRLAAAARPKDGDEFASFRRQMKRPASALTVSFPDRNTFDIERASMSAPREETSGITRPPLELDELYLDSSPFQVPLSANPLNNCRIAPRHRKIASCCGDKGSISFRRRGICRVPNTM